jgi:hypothetical protein
MHEIVSSAAEAELGGLFHNDKDGCPICTCLEELGHQSSLLLLKLTIPLLMELPMTLSNRNTLKLLACNSIGYVTTYDRDSFMYTGEKVV